MTKRYVIRGSVEPVMVNYETQSRARFWSALVRGDDLSEWGCVTLEVTDDYLTRPTLIGTYSEEVENGDSSFSSGIGHKSSTDADLV